MLDANIEKPMPEIIEPVYIHLSYHFCSAEMEIFLSVYIISRKKGRKRFTYAHLKQTTVSMT